MAISLLGSPVSVILALALLIAALIALVSWAIHRVTTLRGWAAKLVAVIVAMAGLAGLFAMFLGPYPTGAHPEQQTAYGFAVYYLAGAWLAGLCIALPVAHWVVNWLQRRELVSRR